MVKDSKTGDFGNCDFSRKNQNFESLWKTTLIRLDIHVKSEGRKLLQVFENSDESWLI